MTVYVYAESVDAGDRWARGQGLAPRHFRTFGKRSGASMLGTRFQPGDRIVIVGEIPAAMEDMVLRDRHKTPEAEGPEVERIVEASVYSP